MVCTTAYLLREPTIEERTEREVSYYNSKTRKIERHMEPYLFPEYVVYFTYNYGFCCGVDGHPELFATEKDAQKAIDAVYANEHEWIKYDPEYMEDAD